MFFRIVIFFFLFILVLFVESFIGMSLNVLLFMIFLRSFLKFFILELLEKFIFVMKLYFL